MGVSENSVPLNPMVLLIIIPFLNGYFIGNINPTFSDKPIYIYIIIYLYVYSEILTANFRCKAPWLNRSAGHVVNVLD